MYAASLTGVRAERGLTVSLAESVSEISTVAYFSMEVGFEPTVPTYSGGLGILAGDMLRAAADLGIKMVGVSLLYRRGYFRQRLDAAGNQSEIPYEWNPAERLDATSAKVVVTIEGRPVVVGAWCYRFKGVGGDEVPLYLLDTDHPENSPFDRTLTD